jgi:hypothetical protein
MRSASGRKLFGEIRPRVGCCHHHARRQRHLRLVVHAQFPGVERGPQAGFVVLSTGGVRPLAALAQHAADDGSVVVRLAEDVGRKRPPQLAQLDWLGDDAGHREVKGHPKARGAVEDALFGRAGEDHRDRAALGGQQTQRVQALVPAQCQVDEDQRRPERPVERTHVLHVGADIYVIAFMLGDLTDPAGHERIVIEHEQPIGTRANGLNGAHGKSWHWFSAVVPSMPTVCA